MTKEEFLKLDFNQKVEIVDDYTTEVNHCLLDNSYERYVYRFGDLLLNVIVNPYHEVENVDLYEKELMV